MNKQTNNQPWEHSGVGWGEVGAHVRTGGEARWEVEELLQELAEAELEKHAMVTAGVAAVKKARSAETRFSTPRHVAILFFTACCVTMQQAH